MNRELIRKSILTFLYLGSEYSEEVCLDQIEAEFKREYESLMQLVRDLQTDNGRLLTDKIIRESKIAEMEKEQGEIVGWVNVYHGLGVPPYSLSGIFRAESSGTWAKDTVNYVATIPIRLPRKEACEEPETIEPDESTEHITRLRKLASYQCGPTAMDAKTAQWALIKLEEAGVVEKKPKVHELKIWPKFFACVRDHVKTFEIRKNDRDFHGGDILVLSEYDPVSGMTGNKIERRVGYILEGGQFGLEKGYVAMQLLEVEELP